MTTHCLIKYVGRKSGQTYIKPLIYGNVGGEIVIVASKGGPMRTLSGIEHRRQRVHRSTDRDSGVRSDVARTGSY